MVEQTSAAQQVQQADQGALNKAAVMAAQAEPVLTAVVVAAVQADTQVMAEMAVRMPPAEQVLEQAVAAEAVVVVAHI